MNGNNLTASMEKFLLERLSNLMSAIQLSNCRCHGEVGHVKLLMVHVLLVALIRMLLGQVEL